MTAAEELRATQAPLKQKYTTTPHSALLTLSSSGTLDSTSLTCSLSSSSALKRIAGLHSAAGGLDPSQLCSGDLLLESLVACFGVTVRAVATSMGIGITGGEVRCEGDLDFRGTLGVKDSNGERVEVGFQSIRLIVGLDLEDEAADRGKVGKLIELSERYCVVLQTLKKGVAVKTSVGVGAGAGAVDKEQKEEKENGTGSSEPTLHDEQVLPLN